MDSIRETSSSEASQWARYLDILNRPPAAPPELTPAQRKRVGDQHVGRELWRGVLARLHKHRSTRQTLDPTMPGTWREQLRFRFFNFPPELRNHSYTICIADDDASYRTELKARQQIYAKDENRQHKALEASGVPIASQLYRNGRISDAAYEAFKDRLDQYRYSVNEEQAVGRGGKKTVRLASCGNLHRRLPAMSLVCRKAFREFWGLLHQSTARFEMKISNGNFFPAFRFLAMLKRNGIIIRESSITAIFEHRFAHLHKLPDLITMHWLFGASLWHYMTGLRTSDRDGNLASHTLGKWLYTVRQMVALYLIDRPCWRNFSIAFLHRVQMVDSDLLSLPSETCPDPELVEATISALVRAMDCRLYREQFIDGQPIRDGGVVRALSDR